MQPTPSTPEKPIKEKLTEPTTPNVTTPVVKSMSSLRKAVRKQPAPVEEPPRATSSRRRTVLGCTGTSPHHKRITTRIRRLSTDPATLRRTIERYGNLVKPIVVQTVEQIEAEAAEVKDENKENTEPKTEPKTEPQDVDENMAVVAEVIDEDKENTVPECVKQIKTLPLPKQPTPAKTAVLVMRATVDSPSATIELDSLDYIEKASSPEPIPADQITDQNSEIEVESKDESKMEVESKTPNLGKAYLTHMSEIEKKKAFDARDTSEPVTPGQTAMKGLFEQPVEATGMATPAAGVIKKLYENSSPDCQITPNPVLMKRTFQKNDADYDRLKTPIQGSYLEFHFILIIL